MIPAVDPRAVSVRFQLTPAGGWIDFTAESAADAATLKSLHSFAAAIQHERSNRRGAETIARLFPTAADAFDRLKAANGVTLDCQQIAAGFRLDFGASDQESRTAIHDFIRTARGDLTVRSGERALNHPGNNLGWDTRRAPDLDK